MTDRLYPKVNAIFYHFARAFFGLLVRLLTQGVHAEGVENIPPEGSFIFVTNHLSYLDSPFHFVVIPRVFYFLAGERYKKHIFGLILRIGGAIFVNRGEVDRNALKQALAALADGQCLGLAPEGTRSKTGALIAARTGAAYLATKADVPILPGVVWGSEQVGSAWHRWRRGPQIEVRYGPLFYLPDGRARADQLDFYTEEIMTTLAAMLPEAYRGVYRDHPKTLEKLNAHRKEGRPS
jgi:1-acyl-sn-glycerol-3-phosphate acyltransferase